MSWIKSSSIGASLGKLRGITSANKEFDATACYDSFRKHWQQICDIIERNQIPGGPKKYDDVRGVICNLDHMVTLLVLELRSNHMNGPCLEHVLSENLLDRLYNWSQLTGRYANVLRVEQLKLYEVLVTQSRTQLLVHEAFHRPLLRLLTSCTDVFFSPECQKRLVILLNQLCISLVQHNDLLHLFFDNQSTHFPKFIIFSLLIPFVHKEGTLGQQARDAILLCMALSKQNESIAAFIIEHSNVCPVLATGLSGLYSLLPRKFLIETEDWHCLTPDDVNDHAELALFMNSLEFCNAVVQVAHTSVRNHLLEFLYQGFLVPVMGPALLQAAEQELIAATAYFDLFVRSLTEPGLLQPFIKFTLTETYDGQRIIDCLIERINNPSQRLSLVTIALMETLIDLNCEDIMLELVFKHLIPCNHVMASQRSKVSCIDPYCQSAEKLFHLHPNIPRSENIDGSLYGDYLGYLADVESKMRACSIATSFWIYSYDGESPSFGGHSVPQICLDSENDHSLPSGDDVSSGYESFAKTGEIASENGSGGEFDSPGGSEINTDPKTIAHVTSVNSTPNIGPFLDAVFNRLENILTQNFFINLHVTGLISRLALYPQPLLRSFLLDHTLVFQPSIRSLFQILSWLKQHTDTVLKTISTSQIKSLVADVEGMLTKRENKLVNARRYALQASSLPGSLKSEHFERGDSKRNSFSTVLAVFRRQTIQPTTKDTHVQQIVQDYRFMTKNDELRNVVMCALLLSEWLKELAAIAQEHTVFRLASVAS